MEENYIDIIKSYLKVNKKNIYNSNLYNETIYYVAGKIVTSSIFCLQIPKIISIKDFNNNANFDFNKNILNRQWFSTKIMQDSVVSTLAGIASTKLFFDNANICDNNDISVALELIKTFIDNYSNFYNENKYLSVNAYNSMRDNYIVSEFKKYFRKAKSIILKNQNFFEAIKNILAQNQEITASKIEELKNNFEIVY